MKLSSIFKKAEASYKEALTYALELKNDTLIGRTYNNLGNIYIYGL